MFQGAGSLEKSRDLRPSRPGFQSQPHLSALRHPSWVSLFLSGPRGPPLHLGANTPGCVDLDPKEAGSSQPEFVVLLQRPPSLEFPHHPFLRLQEKSACSLGLQPGRARAPWKESCDFLNEWLLYHALAFLFLSCIVCFMCDLCQAHPFLSVCEKNFLFFKDWNLNILKDLFCVTMDQPPQTPHKLCSGW